MQTPSSNLKGSVLFPLSFYFVGEVLSEDGLRDLMTKVTEYCTQWQLDVNVKKTKVIVVSKEGKEKAKVKYGNDELDGVTELSYLGVIFASDGKWKKEVGRRLQCYSWEELV